MLGKEQRVVAGALRAIDARTGLGHKLRVLFGERRGGKLQQNVVLNPLLQMANGKQDALGLAAVGIRLLIASGEGLFLLRGLQFRQAKARGPRRSRPWRMLRSTAGASSINAIAGGDVCR